MDFVLHMSILVTYFVCGTVHTMIDTIVHDVCIVPRLFVLFPLIFKIVSCDILYTIYGDFLLHLNLHNFLCFTVTTEKQNVVNVQNYFHTE